jgi:uncharacterized hydrophobic protein (TIGR00271 family)
MSLWSRVINAGGGHRKPLEQLADDLFLNTGDTRAKQSKFWVLLALASLIAAGGVIGDSTPAVIGAMIVAPLAIPIYGVTFAAVIGSRKGMRGALVFLVCGIALNIALGVLAGLLFQERMPLDVNPQVVGRTAPTLLDLAVAVFTGLAGSFALARKDVSDILAGVAIAISLVPVLAVVGITLGAGRFDLALGAFLLFLANAAAILIAGVVVFGAAGYYQEAAFSADVGGEKAVHRRGRAFIIVLLLVLLVPLGYSSWQTQRNEAMVDDTTTAAEQWVEGTDWAVNAVQQRGNTLVIMVLGNGETKPVDDLRTSVRAKVPETVPVILVRESGIITKL